MADFRLGRLKFNWRGDWAADTAYVIDDIVKFGANTYVATANHTSVSTAAWQVLNAFIKMATWLSFTGVVMKTPPTHTSPRWRTGTQPPQTAEMNTDGLAAWLGKSRPTRHRTISSILRQDSLSPFAVQLMCRLCSISLPDLRVKHFMRSETS